MARGVAGTRKSDRTSPVSKKAEYFGQWLRNRRVQELKFTLDECAQAGGISMGLLSELERGLRDPYGLEVRRFDLLAKAYKCTVVALLRRLDIIKD